MGLGALSFDLFYDAVDEKLVRNAVAACLDRDCHTDRDGGTDRHHYLGEPTDFDAEWVPADEALDHLGSVGGVTLFWCDDFDFNLRVDPAGEEYDVPHLSMWLDEVFYRPSRTSEAAVEGRVRTLVDLVCAVAERTNPVAGYGCIDEIVGREGGPYENVPVADLRAGRADVVHWFTLFAADRVDDLGRERVLSSPAWIARELDAGAVALVASAQPLYGGGDQRQAIADHLDLEGPEDRQIVDPERRSRAIDG